MKEILSKLKRCMNLKRNKHGYIKLNRQKKKKGLEKKIKE
jgi:hypothetical protein